MEQKPSNSMMTRIAVLMGLLGVISFVIIGARLFYIQILNYDFYQEKAVSQQTWDKVIMPQRGTIFDRNLKPLAISSTAEMVTVEPSQIKDKTEAEKIAKELSEVLKIDYNTVLKKVLKKSSYEFIKRGVEKTETDIIRKYIKENKVKGIYLTEDSKRYYPFGNFAANVLGFVGTDGTGLDGMEALYDSTLKGTPGRVLTAKNPKGGEMSFEYEEYNQPKNGDGVVLTIDEVVQHFLEKHLETALVDNKVANKVAGIVMDVKTGAILAMATKPDYDPNQPFKIYDPEVQKTIDAISDTKERASATRLALQDQWRNKAVSDSYEPGSTFKILTSAMALEERVVSLSDSFFCKGSVKIAGWGKPIKCWKTSGHGSQSFEKAVENSCNVAFVNIGGRVGLENFYKYATAFGIMEKTGIDMPGESSGVFFPKSRFGSVDLAISAFGQGFTLTPMQLITAVCGVANNGKMMKPYVVSEVVDENGNVKETFKPQEVRQVVSQETSKQLRDILEKVVTEGTGKNAYVAGYRVAGKTGTSEKIAKERQTGRNDLRIASFIGFAPADDPEIAVLVYQKTGGITAAPVVKRIMADVLPYLGVEPRYSASELAAQDINVPTLIGSSKAAAEKMLRDKNLKWRVIGSGDKVTDQIPAAGAKIPGTAQIVLY
ncbi:MAG: penicillin-binding transpeptidase domain-containing protein, partial [Clostridiales bacterium]|nr:penicillin-binding transpeptidase domain-containing protein [Clostridiales bacterium]